jgi:hypothetical protein
MLPVWPRIPSSTDKRDSGKVAIASHKVATSDVSTIAWWLRQYGGDMNWAVVTGPRSGILLIDVESNHGHGELGELQRKHGALPRGPAVVSGGIKGGYHLYFAYPEAIDHATGEVVPMPMRNWARLGTHVECRGNGLLVLVPPSRTRRPYVWAADKHGGLDPWTVPLPQAPEWLLERMAPPAPSEPKPYDPSSIRDVDAYVRKAMDEELPALYRAPDGQRNQTLNRVAWTLMRFAADGRCPRDALVVALMDGAEACGLVKDDGREQCLATIKSAERARQGARR